VRWQVIGTKPGHQFVRKLVDVPWLILPNPL
jgi:hypothetical protein